MPCRELYKERLGSDRVFPGKICNEVSFLNRVFISTPLLPPVQLSDREEKTPGTIQQTLITLTDYNEDHQLHSDL